MADDELKLPRVGATLHAEQVYYPSRTAATGDMRAAPFVQDEHDDFWSICTGLASKSSPIQKFTQDGWVAALFTSDEGFLKIVGPGETYKTADGREMIACTYRRGVRWEFRVLPQEP